MKKAFTIILLFMTVLNIYSQNKNLNQKSQILWTTQKFGLVNKDGTLVTEIKYDKIEFSKNSRNFEGKIENRIETFDNDGIMIK